MIWKPRYSINTVIARKLMEVESAKAVVESTPLSPAIEAELRHQARVKASHYSTRIEGNRLTLKEAGEVIAQKKLSFAGRERDVGEVRTYWDALLRVEDWAAKKVSFSEDLIQRLHAIVEKGRRAKSSFYRKGQNVIRDSLSGGIVYLPPQAKDVPKLMAEMVRWVNQAQKENVPVPIIAALVHYQFVTIHPYYDGNGRTARLLATFILQGDGYGLHGFFSVEEHHAKDLENYYNALAVHQHHNYYEGRADTDLTQWVEYFIVLLAKVFTQAKEQALRKIKKGVPAEPEEVRKLGRRERVIFSLFCRRELITAKDVAEELGLSVRMARVLLTKWVGQGWLLVADSAKRSRAYKLSATYRQHVGSLSAKDNPAVDG